MLGFGVFLIALRRRHFSRKMAIRLMLRWALPSFPENSDSFAATGRIGCRKFSGHLSHRWSSLSLGFGLQREECHERREDFLWVGTDCVAFRASPRTAARRYRRRAAGPSGNRLARRVGHHQGALMRDRMTRGSLPYRP